MHVSDVAVARVTTQGTPARETAFAEGAAEKPTPWITSAEPPPKPVEDCRFKLKPSHLPNLAGNWNTTCGIESCEGPDVGSCVGWLLGCEGLEEG